MNLPLFIFYKDQMIVTDKTEIVQQTERDFLKSIEVFDSSGQRVQASPARNSIVFSEGSSPTVQEKALKEKIAKFLQLSGNPVKGIDDMSLEQTVKASIDWLKAGEWKTYRRGSRLFWTMMLPCGLIPFAIGLFKIPMNSTALFIYAGCFAGSVLIIAMLHRTLYAKPRFSDPSRA